jgi:PAS domain S-box-containing protein
MQPALPANVPARAPASSSGALCAYPWRELEEIATGPEIPASARQRLLTLATTLRSHCSDEATALAAPRDGVRDVAEERLRHVSAQAEQQRRLYETILSSTPDLVYVFDREHRFTYANRALLRMWGRTWEESIGRTCLELGYEPWHAAMHDREIETVITTRRPLRGVVPFQGTHGRRIYDYIFVPVIGLDGSVEAIAGTTRDITELKQKEDTLGFLVELGNATQALTRPEQITATAARLLGDRLGVDRCAYAEVEDQRTFIITGDYPKHAPTIVGRWPVAAFGAACVQHMLENTPYVVSDAESDPRLTEADRAAYRATQIRAVVCVPLHKAGTFTAAMAVHQTTTRVWSPEEIDLISMVTGRCWESLERARIFRSLERNERQLRFMADSMPQKLFTADAAGAINFVNPAWVEYLGRPVAEITGSLWLAFLHPDDRAATLERWQQCVASGEPFEHQHRFRRHDGVYRWHLSRAQPFRTTDGAALLWMGSNTEIEAQKQAEEHLERLVAERTIRLQETVAELEAFSYSIAHDLRAPLRSLRGFADILLEDALPQLTPAAQGYLQRISVAAHRMDRLIQDVLHYSRVGRTAALIEPVDLHALVRGILETYPSFAPEHADIRILEQLPVVQGNAALLTQVFSNLLGNAVKFTRTGVKPVVTLSAVRDREFVRVAVRDDGIGIAPAHQAKIFEIFHQAVTGFGGTGIGLAIVKKAVERMAGRVGVESAVGQGSTFWVELPAA